MVGLIQKPPTDRPVGQQKPAQGSQQAKAPVAPFGRAGRYHIEQGNTQSGIAINVAAPGTFNFPIPSYGYLSCVLLTVTASGGTGVAATYYEDAPWSIIQSLALTDVNGVPIYQVTGYQAYLAAKFGGYRPFGPDISALTSIYQAGSTAGNFNFILPIWLEFGRDGLGCLPNSDASARYNLQVVLASGNAAASGPVYTAAPTGYPTVALQVEVLCRAQPPATDMFGNRQQTRPPALGTVQYWTAQTFSALSGAQNIQLQRVGNLIRHHVLVFRDNGNGTRATAETSDLPTTVEMDWDAGVRYVANLATLRSLLTDMPYGVDDPKGVLLLPNTLDPDQLPFSEVGQQWLPTVGATKLALRFTPAATVQLQVLTNDIVPASAGVYNAGVAAIQG